MVTEGLCNTLAAPTTPTAPMYISPHTTFKDFCVWTYSVHLHIENALLDCLGWSEQAVFPSAGNPFVQ